jgi:hypothetical protein
VAAHLLVGLVGAAKIVAGDRQHAQLAVGDDIRHARPALDQAELAERLPAVQPRQLHDAAVGVGTKHPHRAGQDDIDLAPDLALPADSRAVGKGLLAQTRRPFRIGGQAPQQRHLLRHLDADLLRAEIPQALPQRMVAVDHLPKGRSRHAQRAALGHGPDAGGAPRPS